MAVMMHLLTKSASEATALWRYRSFIIIIIIIQLGVTDIFRNSRWRPPPSWIFRLSKFDLTGVLTV